MKEEIFNQLKDNYFSEVKENEKNKRILETLKQRRNYLKNNALVKQYLDLEKQIKNHSLLVYPDDELLDYTLDYFDKIIVKDNDSNIFVYLGSFIYNNYNDMLQISRNDTDYIPNYVLYGNLETKEVLVLDYEDCEEFEKTNEILVIDDFPNNKILYDTRNMYFKDAFENGQDAAKRKILKKNL